jgi:hypothetical protein
MPRNSEGQYNLPAAFAVPNQVASSTVVNNNGNDIATELTDSLSRSGKGGMEANLDMGNNKITGLNNGASDSDASTIRQLQGGVVSQATTVSGTVDAITANFTPAFSGTIAAGTRIRLIATGANTVVAPTLNVDGEGARPIVKFNNAALIAGDIAGANHVLDLVAVTFGGTAKWELLNPRNMTDAGYAIATALTPAAQRTAMSAGVQLGTSVNSTSGTAIDFTGIPPGVRRITVLLNGVSTSGASRVEIRLGTASGVEDTGYFTRGSFITGNNVCGLSSSSTGVSTGVSGAAANRDSAITFSFVFGNTWIAGGLAQDSAAGGVSHFCSAKELAAALDRIRITTMNGTDVFDGGTVNISWEF